MVGTTIPASFRSSMMALISIIPLPQDMIFWSIILNEVEKAGRAIRYANLTLSGGEGRRIKWKHLPWLCGAKPLETPKDSCQRSPISPQKGPASPQKGPTSISLPHLFIGWKQPWSVTSAQMHDGLQSEASGGSCGWRSGHLEFCNDFAHLSWSWLLGIPGHSDVEISPSHRAISSLLLLEPYISDKKHF